MFCGHIKSFNIYIPNNTVSLSKDEKAEKLIELNKEALRNFKDGNGRTAIHFACR